MQNKTLHLSAIILLLIVSSCNNKIKDTYTLHSSSDIHQQVLTKAERDSLSPDAVLKEFLEGNIRFKNAEITYRKHDENIRKKVTDGQYPKAFVLSCVDSRVPVEDVFDQGLGDVFVGRIAGNFVNDDLIGSMEFACKVAGAKLIIIMGHQHCGAIKGAIDNVEMGYLTSMLENLKPGVNMSTGFEGEKTSKNEKYVKEVNINNIRNSINKIRLKSTILREMEREGKIKIIGAFYTLRNGSLEIIDYNK